MLGGSALQILTTPFEKYIYFRVSVFAIKSLSEWPRDDGLLEKEKKSLKDIIMSYGHEQYCNIKSKKLK